MTETTSIETVLCIPGPWRDQSELVESIVRKSGGYLFAGRVLMHIESGDACELQFEAADPRMESAFNAAGRHWAGTPEMALISDHASVVYLIGEGGTPERIRKLMLAASGLIHAGGYGVKVETAGIAHSPAVWQRYVDEIYLFQDHAAFVIYVCGEDVYSCGMHNFGLRDAIVDAGHADEPAELLKEFTRYLYVESPTIVAGQTFSVAKDAPAYRIYECKDVLYEDGSLYTNPNGLWRLVLIEQAQDEKPIRGRGIKLMSAFRKKLALTMLNRLP